MLSRELYSKPGGTRSRAARDCVREPFAWRHAAARNRHVLRKYRPRAAEWCIQMRVNSLSTYGSRSTIGITTWKIVEERFACYCGIVGTIAASREVLACA